MNKMSPVSLLIVDSIVAILFLTLAVKTGNMFAYFVAALIVVLDGIALYKHHNYVFNMNKD